jgi:hypothetical protein
MVVEPHLPYRRFPLGFIMDTTGKLGRGDKRLLSYSVRLLKTTFRHWLEDRAPQLGAALAYYTITRCFPSLPWCWCEATQTDKRTAGVFLETLSAIAYKEIKKNGEFVLPGFGKLVKQKRKASFRDFGVALASN